MGESGEIVCHISYDLIMHASPLGEIENQAEKVDSGIIKYLVESAIPLGLPSSMPSMKNLVAELTKEIVSAPHTLTLRVI